MDKIDQKPKIKTFLIGKGLKTKDLRHTAVNRASGSATKPNPNPRIASAERRVKPPARRRENKPQGGWCSAVLWRSKTRPPARIS